MTRRKGRRRTPLHRVTPVIELADNDIARTRRALSASAKPLSALNLDGPLLVGMTILAIYGLVIL